MIFWVIFGIIIFTVFVSIFIKIKRKMKKKRRKRGLREIHKVNYKHVVPPSKRKEYEDKHLTDERYVVIVKKDEKGNVEIADLVTVNKNKKNHQKNLDRGDWIVLEDYSKKRGKETAATRKTHKNDYVTNNKYTCNKYPLNKKQGKISKKDNKKYNNKKRESD